MQPESRKSGDKTQSLSIDHDHESLAVRGLLCNRCNVSLGKFEDDLFLIQSAARYLKHYEDKSK